MREVSHDASVPGGGAVRRKTIERVAGSVSKGIPAELLLRDWIGREVGGDRSIVIFSDSHTQAEVVAALRAAAGEAR